MIELDDKWNGWIWKYSFSMCVSFWTESQQNEQARFASSGGKRVESQDLCFSNMPATRWGAITMVTDPGSLLPVFVDGLIQLRLILGLT